MLGPVAVGPRATFVVSDEKNDVVAVGGAVGINPIDVETLVIALSVNDRCMRSCFRYEAS